MTTLSRIFAAPVEEKAMIKQGIVAILNSDAGDGRGRSAGSIRRTLSADMSSKKWLEQNGMKKVVSSLELMKLPVSDSSSSSEGEEEFERREDVWRMVEEAKQKPAALEDVWSSIMMCQKGNDDGSSSTPPPPPYVHPLVKRSSSALSETSLKICTEGLGSETGSDCFSAYCSSDEDNDGEIRVLEEELKEEDQFGDFFPEYKKSPAPPSPPPPLPPPIQSIFGASIHMKSRRENGRLVVEAVSVPPRNFFQAQRCCDGRLVLSLIRTPSSSTETAEKSDGAAEYEENTDEEILEEAEGGDGVAGGDGGYEGEEEAAEETFQIEQSVNSPHKSGVKIGKIIAIGNRNHKADKTAADVVEEEEEKRFTVAQSLPPPPPRIPRLIPRPPTTSTASFESYDYSWRNMTTVSGGGFINKRRLNDAKTDGVKGDEKKVEYFGPYFGGCKEGRRSLSIWEPYCIAT